MAAAVGGIIALSAAPVALLWLKEPPTAKYRESALSDAYGQLRSALASRHLWMTAVFFVLVSIPQGYSTPLVDYKTKVLGFPYDLVGFLQGAWGVGSVLAAAIYYVASRRMPLRALLVMGIVSTAAGTLGYLLYSLDQSFPAALFVDGVNGLLSTFLMIAMMEWAVWATPRSSAAMGFAFLMSALNLGTAIGDILGAKLMNMRIVSFLELIALYSGLTLLMVWILLVLPKSLFAHAEA
jgi:predicted MFS family arabinose efflux permease